MKYVIEYEEVIRRTNSITIEVEDEDVGDDVVNELYYNSIKYDHPDCIFDDLRDMNVKIIDSCQGAENCEYEIC